MVTLVMPFTPFSPEHSLKCSFNSSTVAKYSTFLTHTDLARMSSSDSLYFLNIGPPTKFDAIEAEFIAAAELLFL